MASFPLNRWYKEVIKAEWQHFTAVKKTFNTASAIGNGRYVFDLGGNKYRLVAMIHFNRRTVYIRFIGNHKQCDEIIKSGIIKTV